MPAPRVSVIIDTYNYGRYVEQAVDSALAQDFPREDFEILVVDDGSTDDTPQRLKKYGDAIRYLRKPNGGQASAFNFGFAHTRAEIVALLDADDVWLPNKLKRVFDEFERNPEAGMVYHRLYLWKGGEAVTEDNFLFPVSGDISKDRAALLRYPMAGTPCLAFRRKVLEKLLPIPEGLLSQADAYLTALIIFVAPVAAVPEFLAKYRSHDANLFQLNKEKTRASQLEHRIAMRAVLLAAIRDWLVRNQHDPDSEPLQVYLKQWSKAQEVDEFALHAPKRWKYFRHLWEYPRVYGEIMTTRHRIYSYLRALGGLVLGYHDIHLVDDMHRWYKQSVSAGKNRG